MSSDLKEFLCRTGSQYNDLSTEIHILMYLLQLEPKSSEPSLASADWT